MFCLLSVNRGHRHYTTILCIQNVKASFMEEQDKELLVRVEPQNEVLVHELVLHEAVI